jgi:hypothetical protein
MRHKVRKTRLSAQPVLCLCSYSLTPPVKPNQHTMAAHFHDHSTYRAASVHITHATPTASVMDPHPQTFRSSTPLTQNPHFIPSQPTNQRRFMHAHAFVACSHQTTTMTTIPDLFNARATISHSFTFPRPHPPMPTSIYVLIYPKPIFPPRRRLI